MAEHLIDALAEALESERTALVINDAEALMSANQQKLDALRGLEACEATTAMHQDRLRALMERNRANGVLLARRQREIRWALRHLGRVETHSKYGADGRVEGGTHSRALGVG